MGIFLFIIVNNIIPIFILVMLGYIMNKRFDLDIQTLSKLNFYIFIPSFTFVNIYTTKIPIVMLKVVVIFILILLVNKLISSLISELCGYNRGFKNAFTNSAIFFNAGNIGIPLITLIFSSGPFVINGETPYLEIALTTQVVVLVVQNISINTLGVLNASSANMDWKASICKVLRMPTVYMVPLAFVLKAITYDMTRSFFWPVLNYAKNALIPITLISLGIQISKVPFRISSKEVYLSVLVRLFGGPIIALFFIYLFQLRGVIAQVVMISSALPTAVNTALIAIEYDNYPNFASQAVVVSTLFAAVSLVFMIYIARIIFPLSIN